jgi:hypothetical protein
MSTIHVHTCTFFSKHMLPYVLVYSLLCLVLESSKSAPLKQKWKFQRRRGVFCVYGARTHQGVSTRSQRLKRSTHFALPLRGACIIIALCVCLCALDLTFSQLANGKEDVVGLTHSLSEELTPTLNKTSYNANLSMNLAWADVRSAWKYIYL